MCVQQTSWREEKLQTSLDFEFAALALMRELRWHEEIYKRLRFKKETL